MKSHYKNLVHFIAHKKIKSILYIFGSILFLYYIFPYFLPIQLKSPQISSIVYDRNQNKIGEIIYDEIHRHQRLELNLYPDFLKKSLVQIEDKRFRNHNGIDFRALVRASIENIKSKNIIQGASTINSQIARNQLRLNAQRNWRRKIIEFIYAYILDVRYSKKEILSYYLNTIPMGYLNYGFETAAQRYFNKSVSQLSKAQQIALITISKNPVRYDPYKYPNNFQTRYSALSKILLSGTNIQIHNLGFQTTHESSQPYVIDFIKKNIKENEKKAEIHTTIDDNISHKIKNIADQTIYKIQWKNVSDYGVLVIDKKSHELRVMLGGMFYDGKAGQVNSTTSINQPGSAVKPFTYALAFKEIGLKPNDTIIDEPVQFNSSLGFAYTPQNFSMKYQGEVSIASALAQSLNIPAVKVAEKIGVEKLLNFYHKVGLISLNKSAEYYGLALTLGVGEVSLREMAKAYGIFAYHGNVCEIIVFEGEQSICKKIIDAQYTDMIVDILSNRYNKMPSFPMFSNLDFPDRKVFLKSGTSRSFSDNRVIGFTEDYIIAVWVGNKDGANMKGVSGVSGAGDIFNNIVYYLETKTQTPTFGSTTSSIISSYLNISKPLPNSVFEIDTNIDKSLQGIKFEYNTNITHDGHTRELNNQKIKDLRFPEKGKYILKLKLFSGNDNVGETNVKFEVD